MHSDEVANGMRGRLERSTREIALDDACEQPCREMFRNIPQRLRRSSGRRCQSLSGGGQCPYEGGNPAEHGPAKYRIKMIDRGAVAVAATERDDRGNKIEQRQHDQPVSRITSVIMRVAGHVDSDATLMMIHFATPRVSERVQSRDFMVARKFDIQIKC